MYKMVDISAKAWNKAGVPVIKLYENDDVNKTHLLLRCISDVAKRSDGKNIYDLIDKEIKEKYGVNKMSGLTKQQTRKYKIDRAILFKGSKHSMYVHEDIAITIIMQTRLSDPKTIKFRSDFGFNQINLILNKEQSVVILLLKAFSTEKIKLQHKALENERVRTDMYFFEHKFAVEIDKKGHIDRYQNEENKQQTKIETYSDCKFFHKINPDAEGFDIFLEIGKIRNYIAQSDKEKLKSKFAEGLLSYMSSVSKLLLKPIRYFVKKNTTHLVKHEKRKIKNQSNKNWKRTWTKILFRV